MLAIINPPPSAMLIYGDAADPPPAGRALA
jgi:hypothetical protein